MQFTHTYRLTRALAFAGLALAAGCGDDDGGSGGGSGNPDAGQTDGSTTVTGDITIDRSILINDADTLEAGNFSFSRTVEAIITSSASTAATTPEEFVGSLLATFNTGTLVNPDSMLVTPLDVRPGEAGLSPAALLDPANPDGLQIVGIFNRFDRMPMDGAFCGSARLVYVKNSPTLTDSTITVMFDAAIPNPGQGQAGCRVVAEFWAGLSEIDDAAARAAALEEFLYTGAGSLPAVVDFDNYSGGGAITTDHFINQVKWQMRSFNTTLSDVDMKPAVRIVRLNAPLAEYFNSDFDPAAAGDAWADTQVDVFTAERTAYQDDFITAQVPTLIAPDTSGNPVTANSIIFGARVAFAARYRDFQNDSDNADDLALLADATFKERITTAIGTADVTADQVLNRANAITCGGCHLTAVGDEIGTDAQGNAIVWPAAAPGGFVHINKDRDISELLTNFWLPDRLTRLNNYLNPPASARIRTDVAPTCTLDAVQAAKAAVLASQPGSERQAAVAAYNKAVDQSRACLDAQPTALGSARDPH